MLSVLSAHISSIPPVAIDGVYGPDTKAAVLAAQRRFDLPETGSVGVQTWEEIYNQYSGIENLSFRNREVFPSNSGQNTNYARTTTLTQFPGRDLSVGSSDPVRQEVVR
jgi:hypothetical protein